MKRSVLALFLIVSIVTGVFSCSDDPDSTEPAEQRIRTALYTDRGTDDDCVRATEKMLEWMGLAVVRVTASYINVTELD